MVIFYQNNHSIIYAIGTDRHLLKEDLEKLAWLFGGASLLLWEKVDG
jgi:hypothetical protein